MLPCSTPLFHWLGQSWVWWMSVGTMGARAVPSVECQFGSSLLISDITPTKLNYLGLFICSWPISPQIKGSFLVTIISFATQNRICAMYLTLVLSFICWPHLVYSLPKHIGPILGTVQKTLLEGGGFSIFAGRIRVPPSEDWQNLSTPSENWQNLGAPSMNWKNLGNPRTYICTSFFNNISICVLWLYVSYFIWQNLGAPSKDWQNRDAPLQELAESAHLSPLSWMVKSGHPFRSLHPSLQ